MADYNVVLADTYHVTRNGVTIARCLDGTVADAVADALEADHEALLAQVAELEEQLDAEERKSLALEAAGNALQEAADTARRQMRDTPAREALREALIAWQEACR